MADFFFDSVPAAPLAPAGAHPAVLVAIVDLGSRYRDTTGDDAVKRQRLEHRVLLGWELVSAPMEGTSNNHVLTKSYTLSTHPKAHLRLLVESWTGRPWTDERPNLGPLLGKPCLLTVALGKSQRGSTFASITGLSPVPQGLQVEAPKRTPFAWKIGQLEKPELPPQLAWLPGWVYGERIADIITSSPEWKRWIADSKAASEPPGPNVGHQADPF